MAKIVHIDPVPRRRQSSGFGAQLRFDLSLCAQALKATDEDVVARLWHAESNLQRLHGPLLANQWGSGLQIRGGGKREAIQMHGFASIGGR
jgi:hypothetical protein